MAELNVQNLIDGFKKSLIQDSPFEELSGESMSESLSQQMESFIPRLAYPIHHYLLGADFKDIRDEVNDLLGEQRLQNAEMARSIYLQIEELKEVIFDPDEYFDEEWLSALVIEAGLLQIGFKSSQMVISGVTLEPNYQGDVNSIRISSGKLEHLTIDPDTVRTWNLSDGGTITGLNISLPYYIYAKCEKEGSNGVVIVHQSRIRVDDDPNLYHFLMGVLHTPIGGARAISLTYGHTTIHGKYITTGRIQSQDGYNYIDLDLARVRMGDAYTSLDWNVTTPGQLTIKGGIMQRPSGEIIDNIVFRGIYNLATIYYKGDQVLYDDRLWLYINDNPDSGKVPGEEPTYWRLADGAPGTGLTNRGDWVTGTTYNPGDYVFDRSSADPGINSMWLLNATSPYLSNTQPYLDTDNWEEFAGVPGVDAKMLHLTATSQIFRYDSEGQPDPVSQTIHFEAVESNLTGTLLWFTNPTTPLGGSGNERSLTIADFGSNTSVKVDINKDGLADYITVHRVVDGVDTIISFLTNEAHNVTSNTDGSNPDLGGAISFLRIKKGATLVVDEWTFSNDVRTGTDGAAGKIVHGCTATITISGSDKGKIVVNSMVADTATVTIIATKTGLPNEYKTFSLAKSKRGEVGDDSITSILTNDAAVIPTEADGSNPDFSQAVSFMKIKEGKVDVTQDWTFNNFSRLGTDGLAGKIMVNCAANITITGPDKGKITVISIWSDTASVTVIATRSGYPNEWKTFSLSRARRGLQGVDGPIGASPVYQGRYTVLDDQGNPKLYYGNLTRVDIVVYNPGGGDQYYVTRSDPSSSPFTNVAPTNTAYWKPFGAQFTSVATKLLFAELAYIEYLGVMHVRTSQSGKRVHIDGTNNVLDIYRHGDDTQPVVRISGDYIPSITDVVNAGFSRTQIGRDGFYSFWNSERWFYLSQAESNMLYVRGNVMYESPPSTIGRVYFTINNGRCRVNGRFALPNLPNSGSGLSPGDVYRDGSLLRIMPPL